MELDDFYPQERSPVTGHDDEQPAGVAVVCQLASRRTAGHQADVAHARRQALHFHRLDFAHLSEQERMFFVTILLNEMISWMRSQAGTSSLAGAYSTWTKSSDIFRRPKIRRPNSRC